MVIALIIAGGLGKRMQLDIPKQFISINDKPVIIYTLEGFQNFERVDEIHVVCLEGWENILSAYARQYGITKLKNVVTGGDTVQESIYNGILSLKSICSESDTVIIHDGIRPVIENFVLDDVINVCEKHGNAVTSMPYTEQIFKTTDGKTTNEYLIRDEVRRVSTPQAYQYDKLLWAYNKAFNEDIGLHNSSYTNTLMTDLGETLYLSKGSDKNIKITTKDDIFTFKAYLNTKFDL